MEGRGFQPFVKVQKSTQRFDGRRKVMAGDSSEIRQE